MKIPCANQIPFVITGLSFLQTSLTSIQFENLTIIATAIILGSKFSLTEINRMWLKEKGISTLSYFMSDAKICTNEMMHLYALQVMQLYKIRRGYYIIDDTMKHHTKFCKWIHGAFTLFDHVFGTNLKVTCIVFLYYTDGGNIKFPITFRIFYKKNEKTKWLRSKKPVQFQTKYELALDMLQWALKEGFPSGTVLADSWFGISPFIKGLRRLELDYILEIKPTNSVKVHRDQPKLTPKGRLAKDQHDVIPLPDYFNRVLDISKCGFNVDLETGKKERVLYHTKVITSQLNSSPGKHRIIQSLDPLKGSTKYYLSSHLHYEATKILSVYSCRWVIEEFFRNAKQLSDMEGATIRSEQGVTLSLCLVSWIDFLLHHENYKYCTAEGLKKESLTIPSIIRKAQQENFLAVLDKASQSPEFVAKWLQVEGEKILRKRKKRYQLVTIEESNRNDKQLDTGIAEAK